MLHSSSPGDRDRGSPAKMMSKKMVPEVMTSSAGSSSLREAASGSKLQQRSQNSSDGWLGHFPGGSFLRLGFETATSHNHRGAGKGSRHLGRAILRRRLGGHAKSRDQPLDWPRGRHCGSCTGNPGPGAALCRSWGERRGIRPYPEDPRTPAHQRGAGHVLGHVVGALLLQVVEGASEEIRGAHPGHPARTAPGGHR